MARIIDRLSAPDAETALVAAGMRDISVFEIDLDAADFSLPHLQSTWRRMQELVQTKQSIDKALLQVALQRVLGEGSLLSQLQLERLDALYPDPQECAAQVQDLAHRRRAAAELEAAEQIIHTPNGRWRADLAASAARLQKLALPRRPGGPSTETSWSAADLLAAEFAEPQWAVPGLIPVGLSFLGGRPKVGKSYLALQIAIAKGTGGRVLGREVQQGPALCLALEDNGRRLRERVTRQRMPASALVRFETAWPGLREGGLERLETTIDTEGYRLAIVDTLGRAAGRVDMDDYGVMTDLLGSLQGIALSRDIAILVIDHHGKGALAGEVDPIDAIMGSTGKVGAADAVLGLTRQPGKPARACG